MDDLSSAVGAWGVTAYAPATAFGDGAGGSAAGLLKACGAASVPARVLSSGRQLYIEEIG